MEEEEKKEEVSEIFEVEKDGKEKVVKAKGEVEKKPVAKGQIKKEEKVFKKVLVAMGLFVLFFAGVYYVVYSSNHFTVEGVKFDVMKIGELVFYHTSIPMIKDGQEVDYNFYFRKDPRILINVVFDGGIEGREFMVMNMTGDFNCDGDGVIAVANLQNLYQALGVEVMRDENASCDEVYGRYTFVNIQEGEETYVSEYGLGGNCYNINVNGCEILEGTERFMLETLIEVNKELNQ